MPEREKPDAFNVGAFTIREESFDKAENEIRSVRTAVFSEEQGIDARIDFDGRDADCIHVIARNATGSAVGTARMFEDGHIGRMAVLQAYRGEGIGRALVDALVNAARERGLSRVYLHAQVQAVGFYRALEFQETGEPFMEAGIRHIRMVRQVTHDD